MYASRLVKFCNRLEPVSSLFNASIIGSMRCLSLFSGQVGDDNEYALDINDRLTVIAMYETNSTGHGT